MLLLSGGLTRSRGLLLSEATWPTSGGGDLDAGKVKLDAEPGEAGQRVTSHSEAWGLPTLPDTHSEDCGAEGGGTSSLCTPQHLPSLLGEPHFPFRGVLYFFPLPGTRNQD